MVTEQTGTHREQSDKERNRRYNLSKYFYDLSKMDVTCTVASLIPSVILGTYPINASVMITFALGIISSILLAYIANSILKY